MLVLSWNLYHGRAVPPAGHDLYPAFAAALSAWAWDVALLQECPPWWPALLAADCDAHEHHALTSRNLFLPARKLHRPSAGRTSSSQTAGAATRS